MLCWQQRNDVINESVISAMGVYKKNISFNGFSKKYVSWQRMKFWWTKTDQENHCKLFKIVDFAVKRLLLHGWPLVHCLMSVDASAVVIFNDQCLKPIKVPSLKCFYARQHVCYSASLRQRRVRPSVCHTPVLCLAERKQDREMYTVW